MTDQKHTLLKIEADVRTSIAFTHHVAVILGCIHRDIRTLHADRKPLTDRTRTIVEINVDLYEHLSEMKVHVESQLKALPAQEIDR